MNTHSHQHPRAVPGKIGPDDPRYADLVRRGYNKRFAGRPDYVRLVGSHVSGGPFGYLCRQHGLAADHLYGLEVVVMDETGKARSVVATREPSDLNRDLWWAQTGSSSATNG